MTPTEPPSIESLSARLDTAGQVIAKQTKRMDTLARMNEQLARDYMDLQIRTSRLENQVMLNRQSIGNWSDLTGHLTEDNVRMDLALQRDHEWIQELLRFKHDAESNGQFRREAEA